MENNELILYALAGVFGVAFLALQAYGIKKHAETAALFAPLAQYAIERLDAQLVRYGQQLAPVHTLAVAGQTLIDEATDPLAQALPASVVSAAQTVLEQVENLTDGKLSDAVK